MGTDEAAVKRLTLALASAALLLAFGLRVHLLGAQSLWNDEGSSYVQATRSLADIAFHAGRDIHPPGYYWLLAGWRALTGDSEYALRAFSALASVLAAAFAFGLARRLFGTVAALVGLAFIAVNTFSIYYAQEARMYALLALWSAASLWALVGVLRSRQRWPVAALALANAAGLYTQYAFIYVLLTQAVVAALWLIGRVLSRTDGRSLGAVVLRLMAAQVGAVLLFAPWLPTALNQVSTWPNTGEAVPPAQALSTLLNWLAYGVTANNESLAVAWLLALFGLLVGPIRRSASAVHRPDAQAWAALLPAAWVIVSVTAFMAQGLFRENNLKFLLPAQIGLALWMGRGAGQLARLALEVPRRQTRLVLRLAASAAALVIVVGCVQGLQALYTDPAYQRADYRAMAQTASAALDERGVVILNGPNQAEVFDYYFRGTAQVVGLPAGLGGDDEQTRTQTEALARSATGIAALFWGDRERDPRGVVETALDSMTYPLGDAWYGDVRLARYATAHEPLEPLPVHDVRLGERILLASAAVSARAERGEPLLVELTWRTDAPLDQRYKVFVQLLAPDGTLAAQHDGEPGGDLRPTATWAVGERIADRHGLALPASLAPGAYSLIAGLYTIDPPYARLRLEDGTDFVTLAIITLE